MDNSLTLALRSRWLGTGNKEEEQMVVLVVVVVRGHETEIAILDILSAKFLCDTFVVSNSGGL